MKLLIVFAVIGTICCIPDYYEPDTDLKNTCLCCGNPTCRTFDGAYVQIQKEQKTLVVVTPPDKEDLVKNEDPCKFGMKVVSTIDCAMDNITTNLMIDWIGIGFHVHKNPTKTDRNWILGQGDIIGERGRLYQGATNRTLPWSFPYPGENITERLPYFDPKCLPVTYDIFKDGDIIKIRSPKGCCKWAVDWKPRVRPTCLQVWIGDEYKEQTVGLCGNFNGDHRDDFFGCTGASAVNCTEPYTEECLNAVSDDCINGKHQGQGIEGCTKLDKIGP